MSDAPAFTSAASVVLAFAALLAIAGVVMLAVWLQSWRQDRDERAAARREPPRGPTRIPSPAELDARRDRRARDRRVRREDGPR